jgi:nitrate reductase gamma subunit
MNSLDYFFFSAYPYLAIGVFLVGATYRYREKGYKVTSLSAQFLEDKQGFWGTVPLHWGILMARLILHEGLGFTFAVAIVVGLVGLIIRRLTNPRLKMVTTRMDLFVELFLLAQVLLGCWIALGYRWGSSWFAADLSPYLWSILKLSPQPEAVIAMPLVIKAHIVGAFSIILIFPFTRLVHILVAPFHYLWRPYQVVIWYWDKKRVRDANTEWSEARPRNN